MHSFRLRYIVLGLLIYLQNAFCRTCGSEFDDISSKSLLADIVFEGKVEGKLQSDNQNEMEYKVKFNVKKVYKGELPKIRKRGKKYHPVTAGIFGYDGGKDCNTNVDTSGSKTYIMFLNSSSFNSTQFYQITALPEISSKQNRRDVRNILCTRCDTSAKPPKGSLKPKEVTIQEGKKLNLRCRVTGGNPKPVITWSKDGQQLTKSKKHRFKNSKSKSKVQSSRLRINKVSVQDTGHYTCHITNVLGTFTKEAVVTVHSKEDLVLTPQTPSHAIECEEDQWKFCLNGGTCYRLKQINEKFCKCLAGYLGHRCEAKDVYDLFGELMRPVYAFLGVDPHLEGDQGRDERQFDRSMTILGLVIGVIVLLAVCLAGYCMAKKKKKEYRAKQATRRLQSATYTNVTPRPESGTDEKIRPTNNIELKSMFPSVFDTSTQTEAKWYEHLVVGNGVGRPPPPSYSPTTPPGGSTYRTRGPSIGGESIHSVSAPDVLGRTRLHAVSATPDFDSLENRKPLANATVVNAVVESEPDHHHHYCHSNNSNHNQTTAASSSVKSSPNQSINSRTESEHGIPISNNCNIDNEENEEGDNMERSDSNEVITGDKLLAKHNPHLNNNKNDHTILDFDQQSDYDNQPLSDSEANVESEADTQGLDDDLDSHLLQNKQQPIDSADESDSESSATEEQALFHKLKSSRQSSIQSDLNEGGPFGGLFDNNIPAYGSNNKPDYQQQASPVNKNSSNSSLGQFAFNPYAVDDEMTGNNYFGNFGKPSTMPSRTSQNKNRFTGNDLILQNPLLFDPDPDATPL